MPAVRTILASSLLVLAMACARNPSTLGLAEGPSAAPTNLRYRLEPSGDPAKPAGLLLTWDASVDPAVRGWSVYSRTSTTGAYARRATTTSPSFDERGIPDLQYYVVATDAGGNEGPPSASVTVDERLALPSPTALTSTSLDSKIALFWTDNAYESSPSGFASYRVYSATYDLDTNLCGAAWLLEGTTVAPEFVVAALANGSARCFAISAVSREGFESLWSPIHPDTPRFESRNVAISASTVTPATSGFRFFRDANGDGIAQRGELGSVESGTSTDIDFRVDRDASGALLLVPVRTATTLAPYAAGPVADLTSIDIAPVSGFSTAPLEAKPGFAYVFQMSGGDSFARFGAVRVTNVGRDLLILDWSYQTDAGNPELLLGARGGA